MQFEIKVRSCAEADIVRLLDFYSSVATDLSAKLITDIDATFQVIQKNPRIFQVRYRDVRITFCQRFSVGIHYLIRGQEIIVLAVLSTASSPQRWDR